MFTYENDKHGLIARTKATRVANGIGQTQDVDYVQEFLERPRQCNDHSGGCCEEARIKVVVAQIVVRPKHNHDSLRYMVAAACEVRPFASIGRCMVYSRADVNGPEYW